MGKGVTTDLWTWGGTYFGRREGDDLWTHDGRHVGRFSGDEVYAPNGHYLGELRSNKLITRQSKSSQRRGSFAAQGSRVGHVPYADHVGRVMLLGYEDFPAPGAL